MKKLIFIALIFVCFGCKNNQSKLKGNQIVKDEIVGKYYVEYANLDFKKSIILLKKEPIIDDFQSYYEFNFLKNGEIKIKDLTKMYECGNGVLYFEKSFWEKIGNKKYELNLIGGHDLDSEFDNTFTYELRNNSNEMILKINK